MGTLRGLWFVFCVAFVFVMALGWTGSLMWASVATYGGVLLLTVLWAGATVRDAIQAQQRANIKALQAVHNAAMMTGQEINALRREVAPRPRS